MTGETTSTSKRPKRAPAKLGPRARRLWRDVTGTYQLRPDELALLEDACREVDIVDWLDVELRDAPLYSTGSAGQPVANPLLAEIRQHRNTLTSLLRSLKLPDDPSDARSGPSAASVAGRALVNNRWRR